MEFFRHCQGCGRRFHVKLVTKQLTESEMERVPKVHVRSRRDPGSWGESPIVVDYDRPIIVDKKEFSTLTGVVTTDHEWTEKHTEEHEEGQRKIEQ